MIRLTSNDNKLSEVLKKQRRQPAKSLKEYQEASASRNDAIVAAYRIDVYMMNEIADYFGCHYSTVNRVVAKCKTLPFFCVIGRLLNLEKSVGS